MERAATGHQHVSVQTLDTPALLSAAECIVDSSLFTMCVTHGSRNASSGAEPLHRDFVISRMQWAGC